MFCFLTCSWKTLLAYCLLTYILPSLRKRTLKFETSTHIQPPGCFHRDWGCHIPYFFPLLCAVQKWQWAICRKDTSEVANRSSFGSWQLLEITSFLCPQALGGTFFTPVPNRIILTGALFPWIGKLPALALGECGFPVKLLCVDPWKVSETISFFL